MYRRAGNLARQSISSDNQKKSMIQRKSQLILLVQLLDKKRKRDLMKLVRLVLQILGMIHTNQKESWLMNVQN